MRSLAVAALLTLCAGLGFAAAALAASGAHAKTAPLPPAALTQMDGALHSAMTLELGGIADLKKGTPAAERKLVTALRQARNDVSTAAGILVTNGFRTSTAYNPISNAGNAIGNAVSSHQASRYRLAALRTAISLETKALALLPALAVTTAATTTQTTTTGQTTTSG